MDGTDHYKEAERLLALQAVPERDPGPVLARAQVHATLALAAATLPWPVTE